jgi:putative isomerase
MTFSSPYLELLKNRINLKTIVFTERGSRLVVTSTKDAFDIRLAERWFKRDFKLASYRDRPPLVQNFQFTDETGSPLKLEVTTYPHCIVCETSVGAFTITFSDIETLLIRLPSGRFGIGFHANLDQAETDRRGGVLHLTGDIRRNLAYTTNARILSNSTKMDGPGMNRIRLQVDSQDGQVLMINITPRLGFNRYLVDSDAVIEAAAIRWHDWFAAAPPVSEGYRSQYYYAWWIMRAGLISPRYYTTREAMTPSKIFYVGVWQWDAFFHALAYRYIDKRLAQDQLRILLDHQTPEGLIPDAIHDEGTVTHLDFPIEADVTKPPLIAWAAWKLYEYDHDREFLDEIYEPIIRWNRWWFEKNDVDNNGLCEYQHPYSSGLDDSPLWDGGMPVESPDLNSYLVLQQQSLSKIAGVLGLQNDADTWLDRSKTMSQRLIEQMWDKEEGLFWAHRNGTVVKIRTPFSLFPLLTGQLPPKISNRLVAHLLDPKEFWPRYPVPSVALNDPNYDPQQMWRGPTWVNVNYLLAEGLEKSGFEHLALDLSRSSLELMNTQNDFYEYYNPETGENPPKAASVFGWSSAIYIDLAIRASRYEA